MKKPIIYKAIKYTHECEKIHRDTGQESPVKHNSKIGCEFDFELNEGYSIAVYRDEELIALAENLSSDLELINRFVNILNSQHIELEHFEQIIEDYLLYLTLPNL